MRTLFAKILLWFWCTLAITVVGSAFISAVIVNRNASDRQSPAARLVTFQLEEARLADESGRDLLTNEDRSDLVNRARRRATLPIIRTTENMVARTAEDGRYWFFF